MVDKQVEALRSKHMKEGGFGAPAKKRAMEAQFQKQIARSGGLLLVEPVGGG